MMTNKSKLYNIIFPTFMLFAFLPKFWIGSIIGNFVIDTIILLILIKKYFGVINIKFYSKTIIPIWGLGFLADLLGTAYLVSIAFSVNAISSEQYNSSPLKCILSGIRDAINYSIFENIWSFLYVFSGILIAGLLIFLFDRAYLNITASNELTKTQCTKIALVFAICTAPYTFLLPRAMFV